MTSRLDVVRGRAALVEALEQVGPDAPTLCPHWTSADIAAHVAGLDRLAGVPTFLGRLVVSRLGLRLNEPVVRFPRLADATVRATRRRGFDWALEQLRRDPPRALLRPSVAAVGLFEVWVHDQDVRRANDISPRQPTPDLGATVPWLLRYHRRFLRTSTLRLVADDGREWAAGHGPEVTVAGPVPELVLWLAGRHDAAAVAVEGDATPLHV